MSLTISNSHHQLQFLPISVYDGINAGNIYSNIFIGKLSTERKLFTETLMEEVKSETNEFEPREEPYAYENFVNFT